MILENKKFTKQDAIGRIPLEETLYVLYSDLTRVPYVECDAVTYDDMAFFFAAESAAVQKTEGLKEDKKPVHVVRIEQKNCTKLFLDLILYGINAIVFQLGTEKFMIQMDELVKRPEIPKEKRMLENPQLQLSMIYYMQEARRPIKNEEKQLAQLEEEVTVNIMRASYYIPYREEGEKQNILLVQNGSGQPMIPIFTDSSEYFKFSASEGKMNVAVMSFDQLADLEIPEEVKGYVINPVGTAVTLPQVYMKNLRNGFR